MHENELDTFLKDLLQDMKYALDEEDQVITVSSKDVNKVTRLINRNKRRDSLLVQRERCQELFERKYIAYREMLVFIYELLEEENTLKRDLKCSLQEEQGDFTFEENEGE